MLAPICGLCLAPPFSYTAEMVWGRSPALAAAALTGWSLEPPLAAAAAAAVWGGGAVGGTGGRPGPEPEGCFNKK